MADVKESTDKARSLVTKPFEEAERRAGGGEGERSTVTRTLMVAGAAAVAGGLAGAAQDWLARRDGTDAKADEPEARADAADEEPGEVDGEPTDSADEGGDETSGSAEQPEDEDDDEPRAQEPEEEDEPKAAEPQDEEEDEPRAAEPQDEEEDEPRAEEPHDDDEDADDEPEARGDEEGARDEHGGDEARDEHGGGGAGAPLGRVGKLVRGAAEQLEQLVGAEAEGVSAMRRADGGWVMTLEVVEVRRVPNSTDVLASYEVRVDDDGEIVDFERGRRYRRGQVDED